MAGEALSRSRLIEILSDPDSPEREAILCRLTGDERRVILHRLLHVPAMARLDPNRIPPAPFPDREMKRLATSLTAKLMEIELGRLLDDEGPPEQ